MKLIVGLGNPGPRYAKTRHNIGRRLVERLALESQARWKASPSLHSRWARVNQGETPFLVALPESFMNESGEAVRGLLEHFGIDSKSDLLVVVDDVALPLGRLRLRARGQDGGHRGLRSIERVLGSRAYARLRIGISPGRGQTRESPVSFPLEKYVLRPFERKEEKKLEEVLRRGIESCTLWVTAPIEKAMDRTNPASP